jgi:predicted MPP superfamily phosphohydrolase
MRFVGPILFASVTATVFGLALFLLTRYLNPQWWRIRAVRWATILLPAFTALSMAVWGLGFYFKAEPVIRLGSMSAAVSVVILFGLIIAMPFSGILNQIRGWLDRRDRRTAPDDGRLPDPARRRLLRATAVGLPVLSVAVGKFGIARSFQDSRVYLRRMRFDRLPGELQGFRILHLTDSHLGILRFLDDLKPVLKKAARYRPDLVLVTGDVADDLDLLKPALEMIAALNPPYGCYASLGNHEYSRGIDRVLRIFEGSRVKLLRSEGVTIDVNGTPIHLAGADDPRRMGRDNTAFLKATVDRAIQGTSPDAFTILMSHRPEGFRPAAEHGVDLTLSGHTHGGQVGFNGRSFWRHFKPGSYLWGTYRIDLSAGIGHWFPFRLGCPPEAPVIELTA